MKSEKLRIALEILKGSVSTETDAVELNGQTARVTNGVQWAEATLPDPISSSMILPHSKFLSIVRTLDDDDNIQIEPDGPTCRVKAQGAAWQLNLLDVPMEPPPEFTPIDTITTSGYALLDARKSLRHLIVPFPSREGFRWAWINEKRELVIGNGTPLGGYSTGIERLELPTIVLSEIWRILSVRQSGEVIFEIGEKYIRATMRDTRLQFTLSKGPGFDVDWYHKVRNLAEEDPQVIQLSRSYLLHATEQVRVTRVTAAEPTLKLAPGNKSLILTSLDGHGNKSASKIDAFGSLKEPISLNIDHLASAVEVRSEEMITLKVCKSVVEVSDTKGWEIIFRR